jgi:hypothetical protein
VEECEGGAWVSSVQLKESAGGGAGGLRGRVPSVCVRWHMMPLRVSSCHGSGRRRWGCGGRKGASKRGRVWRMQACAIFSLSLTILRNPSHLPAGSLVGSATPKRRAAQKGTIESKLTTIVTKSKMCILGNCTVLFKSCS